MGVLRVCVPDWSTCQLSENAVCGEGFRLRLLDCVRSDGKVVESRKCEQVTGAKITVNRTLMSGTARSSKLNQLLIRLLSTPPLCSWVWSTSGRCHRAAWWTAPSAACSQTGRRGRSARTRAAPRVSEPIAADRRGHASHLTSLVIPSRAFAELLSCARIH